MKIRYPKGKPICDSCDELAVRTIEYKRYDVLCFCSKHLDEMKSLFFRSMKYYEIQDPYYAVIKANTTEEAIEKYVEIVADDEDGSLKDEIKEISRDLALVLYSRSTGDENEMMETAELIESFERDEVEVLVMTSELV